MLRTVHPLELSNVDVEHLHMQTRASHSTFCSEHFEFVRMMAMCCRSTTSPSENVPKLTGHEVVMELIPVEFPGHEEHLSGLPDDPLQTSQCIPPRVLIQLHQSLVSLEHSTRNDVDIRLYILHHKLIIPPWFGSVSQCIDTSSKNSKQNDVIRGLSSTVKIKLLEYQQPPSR